MSKMTISDLGQKMTHNDITFEFNRYEDTPTMELTLTNGDRVYLSPFRGYRFQISQDARGNGLVAEGMLNTKMAEIAHLSCAHALLAHLAFECIENANVEKFSAKMFNIFIDECITWLLANEEKIASHNTVYQASAKFRGKWRDLA